MTLKVGETYKARNGKAVTIVEDIRGGLFRGNISADSSVIYRADGTSFTSGWSDWEINLGHRIEVIDPFAQERIPPCLTDERIAALEMRSQKACIDLASRIRANSELIADLAAKVGELVERLDGTDRRVGALREGMNGTDHEGENVKRRLDDHEKRLNKQGRLIGGNDAETRQRFEALETLYAALSKRLEDVERMSEPAMVNRRLHQLATDISKLGADLVRIEDMLTAEKLKPVYGRTAAKHVIKSGWVNVYCDAAGPYFSRPWFSREGADAQADPRERRFACIQIQNITDGEGL